MKTNSSTKKMWNRNKDRIQIAESEILKKKK